MSDINTAFPAPTPDVFGPIVSAADVRQALDRTEQTWSSLYIGVVAARSAVPLNPFGSWEAVYDVRALPADLTAACWSTCTTTDPKQPPTRSGAGTWRSYWHAQSNIAVYGTDWASATDLIGYYLAAVRAAVLQHRSLGGFANSTHWLGEASKQIEHQALRTVQLGVIQWSIDVAASVSDAPKPTVTTLPGTQATTANDVTFTLTKEPLP